MNQIVAANYDLRLVAVSVAIAVVASYAALSLAGRVTASRGRSQFLWLIGGGLAMGSGIWCMHFTGMLAYRLPLPVFYHVPTVLLSLCPAVVASVIALYVAGRENVKLHQRVAGALLMGAGIATMHYTGMASMRLAAMHYYHRGLCALSVLLAVVISFAALMLLSYARHENRGWVLKGVIAMVMGLAIPVMHYTGMAAVTFMPIDVAPDLSLTIQVSILGRFVILAIVVIILGVSLVTSLFDRQFSAQQLRLGNEREMLRTLIDNIPDFLYVKDAESRFVVVNLHLARAAGVETPDAMLGKTEFDFFPKEIAAKSYADEQSLMQSGHPILKDEQKSVDRVGELTYVLTTKVPLHDSNGRVTGIVGVGHDISDRKMSEDAVREADRKYRGIFDEAIVGIFQSTPNGRFTSVNPALARMFGYDSQEQMVTSVTDVRPPVYVDTHRQQEYLLAMDSVGSTQSFECEVFRKDQTKMWISISARAVRRNDRVIRYEGMSEEITDRKLLQEQLHQAQKLESVGQLAAGIAHEINTPMQFIGDNAQFLTDAFEEVNSLLATYIQVIGAAKANTLSVEALQEASAELERADAGFLLKEIPKALEQTREGINRVSTLVGAMKEFSHPGTKTKVPLDLNRAIQSTLTVTRHEWKYVADVETEYDSSLPLVSCLPGEFNQVILNLVVNAAHAIADVIRDGDPKKGKIKIRTRNCPEWVEIRIQDTGTGIPKSVASRIFDPFFTTKGIGKGTGQGLAIARSVIVDKHGGSITFETEEGKGTTFTTRIPHDGKALTAMVPA